MLTKNPKINSSRPLTTDTPINQFMQEKIQKDYQMLENKKKSKKQMLNKRIPKKYSINNYSYNNSEISTKSNKYDLPVINFGKNPLLEMKNNHSFQKSQKILINRSKNTKILNEIIRTPYHIIEILKQTEEPPKIKHPTPKPIGTQQQMTQNIKINPKKQVKTNTNIYHKNYHIIHPQFAQFPDQDTITRRTICSQKKSRFQQLISPYKTQTINYEDNPNLLTFYKPFKNYFQSHCQNEPHHSTNPRNQVIHQQFLIDP